MSHRVRAKEARAMAHGWLCQGKSSQAEIQTNVERRTSNVEQKPDGRVRLWPCPRCESTGWVKESGDQNVPAKVTDRDRVPCPGCFGKGWKGEIMNYEG